MLEFGEHRVDLDRNEVYAGGRVERLTPAETKLLRYMVENANRTVSQPELLQKVWDYALNSRSRTVQATVGRLRKKIEDDPSQPRFLLNVHGSGYRLVMPKRDGTPLLGRTAELAALVSLRGALALVGPGGVGKSRLAREVAESSTAAWVRVSLLEAEGLDGVVLLLAAACGVQGARGDAETHLYSVVAAAPELVLLDDAEHVPEAAARVALALAAASHNVLVTSRVELPGVESMPIEPLPHEDAIELLVRCIGRGSGSRPQIPLGPIVEALDRLPLAIELAAGQVALAPLEQLVQRLDWARVPEGTGRHRSVTACVTASLDLQRPEDQAALALLGTFSQGFDLRLAEALLGPEALEVLTRLEQAWLVHSRQGRLQLPETVRWVVTRTPPQDAADRAAAALLAIEGDEELANARALLAQVTPALALDLVQRYRSRVLRVGSLQEFERWLDTGESAAGSLQQWDVQLRLARFRPHVQQWGGNTVAALSTTRALAERAGELGLERMAFLIRRDESTFLRRMGQVDAALELTARLLEELPTSLDEIRPLFWSERSDALQQAMRLEEAAVLIDKVVTAHVASGNRHKEGLALGQKARCLRSQGHIKTAIAHYHACVQIFRDVEDAVNESIYLGNLANAQMDAGRLEDARPSLAAARLLSEAQGNRQTIAYHLHAQGRLHRLSGEAALASGVLITAAFRFRALGIPQAEATVQAELALVLWDQGADAEARAALADAEELLRVHSLEPEPTVEHARTRALQA